MQDSSSDSDLASLHAVVRGLVQGVYFRVFVRHHAAALGLSGYVRNLPHTGAVEVKAEGERVRLEELLKHLHRGPADARVERVEVVWGEYSGDFHGFIITH
jgi:acylphosphatase